MGHAIGSLSCLFLGFLSILYSGSVVLVCAVLHRLLILLLTLMELKSRVRLLMR